jgi:hypothetical protein
MRTFLLDALAVHRLTRLVVDDVITEPLREAVYKRYPPHDRSLSYVLTCPHCASVWVAAGVVLARILAPGLWSPVAKLLALSALTETTYALAHKLEDS